MLLPFSAKGKRWEPHGEALRRLLGLAPHQLLDPYQLAVEVGLRLVDVRALCEQLGPEITKRVLVSDRDGWSGGVFARPLGLLPSIRREVYMILRNEEECHVEGQA